MLLGICPDPSAPAAGGRMPNAAPLWERWPALGAVPSALAWLSMRADLGLAHRSTDAYARGLSAIFHIMLDYLSSLELRHLIQAATNKSELFNKYAQWVAFGESGLESEGVRDEQRKLIKYNLLAANLLIFHTLVSMTRGLDQLATEGMATEGAALAGLSPYHTEHINRFGNYTLDFARIPVPSPIYLRAAPLEQLPGLLPDRM